MSYSGVCLGVLLLASSALAQVQPSTQVPVRVGVPADWPPQYSVGDLGHPKGFAIDVMEAVARRAGLTVTYRVYPNFTATMEALRRKEIDVIPDIGNIASRNTDFVFTSPVETFVISVFTRADTPQLRRSSDIVGRRVGVVKGNYGAELVAGRPGVQSVLYDDIGTALMELLSGSVDAIVFPKPVALTRLRATGLDARVRVLEPPVAEVKRAMAVNKDSSALAQTLQQAVSNFVGTPAYEEIYRRWFGASEPLVPPNLVAVVAVVALVLVLIFVGAWRLRSRSLLHKALAASERRFRSLVENGSDAIVLLDEHGQVIYASPATERILDRPLSATLGAELSQLVTDNDRDGFIQRWQACLKLREEAVSLQVAYQTPTGIRIADGVLVNRIADPDIRAVVYVFRDITEQRRLEEHVQQAHKLEALGRLAGGIAHDFNNILAVIIGYSEALKDALDGGPLTSDVTEILSAAERARALTEQLLAFSRQRTVEARVVNPGDTLRGFEKMLRRLVGEAVEVTTYIEAPLWHVRVDPHQLEQVLMNLAVNSRDAMPEGGKLRVEAKNAIRNGAQTVCFAIEDTGSGIPADLQAKIFDPFFTTKAPGKGTGLGLATSYGIIHQAGGDITVSSEPGRGTRFEVFLPRCDTQPFPAARDLEPSPSCCDKLILVVEDQDQVRRVTARTLERLGYQVLEAEDGKHALSVCEENGENINLLLTDLVMPRLSGVQLAHRLREKFPHIKIVLMSGFAEEQPHGSLDASPVLRKPFSPRELATAVRAALS